MARDYRAAMHDLRLCPCGRVHVVWKSAFGIMMACPLVGPDTLTIWNDQYLPTPATIHVPRPETVW